MPRAQSDNRRKAKEIYDEHNGQISNREIAGILGCSEKSISGWKCKDNWIGNKRSTPNEKERSTPKKCKQRGASDTELLPEEIETLNNEELTDKQRLFCLYYSKSFNATRAYQKAYDCDYASAMVNGPRLLGNARVKDEIMRLKKERCAKSMLTQEDIFQKYMDIAFADVTDFLDFGQEEMQVTSMHGPVMVDGEPITKMANVVFFKDSSEVDGTLISEVKQGKDGASIKLPDRMKALQWLSDHMGWATELQKAQLAQIQAQTDKLRVDAQEAEETEDDGFLEAIKNAEIGEWSDEEV